MLHPQYLEYYLAQRRCLINIYQMNRMVTIELIKLEAVVN